MNFQKFLIPLASIAWVIGSYYFYGWQGVALAVSALVMWVLLHFNRIVQILQRASNRPIGYVDSAVMLNAKLAQGVTLMHVIAMTRSLGELLSPADTQPELYRWTDATKSHVTAEFSNGKLNKWELWRPDQAGTSETNVSNTPE
jgi:signal transduction histidine kinase